MEGVHFKVMAVAILPRLFPTAIIAHPHVTASHKFLQFEKLTAGTCQGVCDKHDRDLLGVN